MLSGICLVEGAGPMIKGSHIHTSPQVSSATSSSDDSDTEEGWGRSPNRIDRAVWPAGFVHVKDAASCTTSPSTLNRQFALVNPGLFYVHDPTSSPLCFAGLTLYRYEHDFWFSIF
jgi:hypothetical protein